MENENIEKMRESCAALVKWADKSAEAKRLGEDHPLYDVTTFQAGLMLVKAVRLAREATERVVEMKYIGHGRLSMPRIKANDER